MAPRIYSFDILGAGAGSLAVMGLLFVLPPQDALRLIGHWGSPLRRSRGWNAAARGAGRRRR